VSPKSSPRRGTGSPNGHCVVAVGVAAVVAMAVRAVSGGGGGKAASPAISGDSMASAMAVAASPPKCGRTAASCGTRLGICFASSPVDDRTGPRVVQPTATRPAASSSAARSHAHEDGTVMGNLRCKA